MCSNRVNYWGYCEVMLIEIDPDALTHATTGCRFQFGDAFLHLLVKRLAVANERISLLLADQHQTGINK
jgi:hypothetical protein